jgi:CxxC motif-containing protein
MRELICIVCPNGCRLQVEEQGGELLITGNLCKRGLAFAEAEITHPTRTVTSTVRTAFPDVPVLPVRTDGEIPKGKIPELMEVLRGLTIQRPLKIGETVVENLLGLGVNLIATSNILGEDRG